MSLILVICFKQEKYCDIERAAGAPAKISRTKVRFKRLCLYKKNFWKLFLLKYRQITCREKEQGAMPENLI